MTHAQTLVVSGYPAPRIDFIILDTNGNHYQHVQIIMHRCRPLTYQNTPAISESTRA